MFPAQAWLGWACCGVVWCGVVWCGLVWFSLVTSLLESLSFFHSRGCGQESPGGGTAVCRPSAVTWCWCENLCWWCWCRVVSGRGRLQPAFVVLLEAIAHLDMVSAARFLSFFLGCTGSITPQETAFGACVPSLAPYRAPRHQGERQACCTACE